MNRDYKVNRLLWETLEATLLAHGKRFVKDMAETLLVDEKVLLRHVFPSKDVLKVSIQDSDASLCMAAVSVSETIATRCRGPVQTGTEFCVHHQHRRPLLADAQPLRRLKDRVDCPPLWLLPDQTVIDSEGRIRGSLVNQRLMLIT
jgi:hypothetical protein